MYVYNSLKAVLNGWDIANTALNIIQSINPSILPGNQNKTRPKSSKVIYSMYIKQLWWVQLMCLSFEQKKSQSKLLFKRQAIADTHFVELPSGKKLKSSEISTSLK